MRDIGNNEYEFFKGISFENIQVLNTSSGNVRSLSEYLNLRN